LRRACPEVSLLKPRFMQGNEACAEGAILAGCKFFAGYPITPQSEIMRYMAEKLPKLGGVYIQAEDEIAAICSVIGASWAGAKAMTATSGPGFSLMQEALSYAVMTETPLVVVDVQRLGPSTGQATKCGQGDIMQSRWGRHGDQALVVLAPYSPQEMLELTARAFSIACKLRTPVIVLSDETVAHMREEVYIPEGLEAPEPPRPKPGEAEFFGSREPAGVPPMPRVGDGFNVMVTGSTHDSRGYRKTADPQVHRRLVTRIVAKIESREPELRDIDYYGVESPELLLVAVGSAARSVKEAVRRLLSRGARAALFRPRTLFPFPASTLSQLAEEAKAVLVVELNLGQLIEEVRKHIKPPCRVEGLNKIGGGEPIAPSEVEKAAARLL